jgi:acetolactate synthase-1/2/3 large subunit
MGQSDLLITIGRKLDFQLAYGSPAVFGNTKLLRLSDSASEIRDNRRGDVELLCDPGMALQAILDEAGDREPATDMAWSRELRNKHIERCEKLYRTMQEAEPGSDGLMHPNRLLAALRKAIPKDSVIVADGGDFLSFARVGLPATTYLDPGSLGCIGIGTPFGISASLNRPDQTVVVATGDGSFGFNAMEIDTAVRHNAPVLIVVANNGSWAIEVTDQKMTHGKVTGTHLQFSDYSAMARSFGMHAERVEKPEDLPAAIERALANRPALLDVLVTPEAVSSDAKSGLAWVPDLQPLTVWNDAETKWRGD